MGEPRTGKPWPLAMGLTLFCLVVLFGGGAYVVMAARPERVTKAPTKFKAYTAKDQSFKCLQPEGWQVDGGAAQGVRAAATFTQGGATIRVSSDLEGSLMGDLSKSPMDIGGVPSVPGGPNMGAAAKELNRPPVEKVHLADAEAVEGILENYGYGEFADGQMQSFQSTAGDARFSEFTADGGMFGGKIKGMRTTALGGERRIRVLAYCLEEDWTLLKPSFQKVITSVTPGQAQ